MLDVQGLKELQNAIKKMGDKAVPFIQEAVNDGGNVIYKKAVSKAKGNLKNGLKLSKSKGGKSSFTSTVSLKKGYEHGVPVELGHQLVAWGHPTDKHITEKPFMRPAADESENELEKIVADAMDKILKEFGG